jgi:hypothetical protein
MGEGQRHLGAIALAFRFDELASAIDGVSLFIQKLFYANDILHILAAVEPLAGVALVRFELRKLRFPEAEDVSGQRAKPSHFTDAEEELVGNQDVVSRLSRSHNRRPFCSHERIVSLQRAKVNKLRTARLGNS